MSGKSGIDLQPKPEGNHYVTIHDCYRGITDGSTSSAGLLSVIEWLAESTLTRQIKPGEDMPDSIRIDGNCNNPLLVWALDGLIKGSTLKAKLKLLEEKGYISLLLENGRDRIIIYHRKAIAIALSGWRSEKKRPSEKRTLKECADRPKNGHYRPKNGGSTVRKTDTTVRKTDTTIPISILGTNPETNLPPYPPNGGDGEQEDFENVEDENQESLAELLPVKNESSTKAIAMGRGKSSAAKSSRKKKQLPSKSQYHAEECDRLWAVWNPLFQEMRGTRDSLKGFVSGYDWLIETGVSPDDIEEGLTYYVQNKWAQFRDGKKKSPIMPPDGIRFFKGSRDHPDSYCLDALEMKKERVSGRVVASVTSDEQIQAQKNEIGRELRRLNLPGVLSPDWAAHFGVQFVGELNHEQGAEFLRSLKETPDREVSRV